MREIPLEDYEKVEAGVKPIFKVENFPEAKKRVYKIHVDFGRKNEIKRNQLPNYEHSFQTQTPGPKDHRRPQLLVQVNRISPIKFILTGFVPNPWGETLAVSEKSV